MIAAKWDSIWERLSSTCYDGLGFAFPPYARSSCAYWTDIDDDEAIVVGAISESEFEDYMAQFPYEPLKDREGNIIPIELLQAAVAGADEVIYRLGGPRPGASRAERVDHMRKQREESNTRIREEYEQRNAERDSQNAVFRLLEEVETLLRDAPCIVNSERWEWLCKSLSTLTATEHFERYPNWRARAWVASATMYRHLSDSNNELACLECALKLNAKLPIKRRIKALETQK